MQAGQQTQCYWTDADSLKGVMAAKKGLQYLVQQRDRFPFTCWQHRIQGNAIYKHHSGMSGICKIQKVLVDISMFNLHIPPGSASPEAALPEFADGDACTSKSVSACVETQTKVIVSLSHGFMQVEPADQCKLKVP